MFASIVPSIVPKDLLKNMVMSQNFQAHVWKFLFSSVDRLHLLIFRHRMSPRLADFLKHLSWSMVGLLISSIFLLLGRILAGRLLGPAEFGKINLLFAITQFFFVFSLFGLDRVSLRSIAGTEKTVEKSKHISTAFYSMIAFFLLFSVLYFLLLSPLSSFFEVDSFFLILTFVYGGCLILRQILTAFLRGLEAFKYQAITQALEAVMGVALFLVLWWILPSKDYFLYLASLILPSLLFSFLCTIKIRSHLSLHYFSREAFREYFAFCRIYFVSLIFVTLFTSLDKFLIGKYLGHYQLGIYSAYFSASFLVISQLNTIVSNVFFPTVSKHARHLASIMKKIDRLMVVGFLPAFIFFSLVTLVIVAFFGAEYPLQWDYILGFSLIAMLNTMVSINGSFVQVHSNKALARVFFWNNFSNVLLMGVYGLLLWYGLFSLQTVIMVLVVSYAVAFFIYKVVLLKEGAYETS